ncbi:hypothetical protein AW40_07115 [Kosakonia radicincitans UMEnt01/12]|uniref:DUF1378 family protein n=1 Tax=Kosakonia radicincitans TaxID=283686 RepID=UPI0004615636|nr:DUF1378 family protein [Kosakonia radicincitans]KDE37411.1 hypothetical protein AW40_07115 [Kosakonia radicincitans UMEnt01/12]
MTFIESVMLYFSTAASALFLIAGGWVKIRDYFKAKAQVKADAAQAEFEAAVQARLKQLQEENAAAPDATATSVSGTVVM